MNPMSPSAGQKLSPNFTEQSKLDFDEYILTLWCVERGHSMDWCGRFFTRVYILHVLRMPAIFFYNNLYLYTGNQGEIF